MDIEKNVEPGWQMSAGKESAKTPLDVAQLDVLTVKPSTPSHADLDIAPPARQDTNAA